MLGAGHSIAGPWCVRVLRQLARRLATWRDAGGADAGLRDDYRAHSLTIGARVRAVLPGDRHLEGIARSVDEQGRLCIDTGADVTAVSAGDIVHLRSPGATADG